MAMLKVIPGAALVRNPVISYLYKGLDIPYNFLILDNPGNRRTISLVLCIQYPRYQKGDDNEDLTCSNGPFQPLVLTHGGLSPPERAESY